MSYSLTVLNYLKVDKLDKKTGLAPVFLRITIGGQRVEISAKRSWDYTPSMSETLTWPSRCQTKGR